MPGPALLALLAALAGGPSLAFVEPRDGDSAVVPMAIELRLADLPPGDPPLVELEADGVLVARLEPPLLSTRYTPSTPATAPIRLTARARLASGQVLKASVRVRPIAINRSIDVELVLTPVVVVDRQGRGLPDLGAASFRLKVDGRDTPIEHFARGDAPFSAVLLTDVSSSMVGRRFEAAREAARAFVARLGPDDRTGLIAFDHRATVLAPLSSDPAGLRAGIDAMRTGGGTAIYDALDAAIRLLRGQDGRKAILLLTDGEDSMSRVAPAAVERAARRSQVVLYVLSPSGAEAGDGWRRLAELADDLGGRAVAPGGDAALLDQYTEILDEMRAQYTLGFTPTAPRDGRWHRIQVKVDVPGARVRARKGWLADGKS